MNDLDRRVLAAACGLKWHKVTENPEFAEKPWTGMHRCSCGKGTGFLHHNPSFTSPDDWEMVRKKVVVPHKELFHIWLKENTVCRCHKSGFEWWLTKSPEECDQLAADFIKANPDLYPWVVEMIQKGEGDAEV